jgi:hypothetical protein
MWVQQQIMIMDNEYFTYQTATNLKLVYIDFYIVEKILIPIFCKVYDVNKNITEVCVYPISEALQAKIHALCLMKDKSPYWTQLIDLDNPDALEHYFYGVYDSENIKYIQPDVVDYLVEDASCSWYHVATPFPKQEITQAFTNYFSVDINLCKVVPELFAKRIDFFQITMATLGIQPKEFNNEQKAIDCITTAISQILHLYPHIRSNPDWSMLYTCFDPDPSVKMTLD